MARCPTCKAEPKPRSTNPAFPFCSPRCKAVDLGRWFTGAYVVPGKPVAPRQDPGAAPRDDSDE